MKKRGSVSTTFGPAPRAAAGLFAARRSRLLGMIGEGIAIIPAGPELVKSRDTEIRYRQASDFYYLTGFPEPEAVAVLNPKDTRHPYTLFVRERDPDREVWVGPRIGVLGAREEFGAQAAHPIAELAARLPELLRGADGIHYSFGGHPTLDTLVREAVVRARRTRPRSGVGPSAIIDLELLLGSMRLVKDDEEIARIRTASAIAAAGHRAAMGRTAPGVGEWEIQGALEGAMRAMGSDGPSFPTIVGSGSNATTLHYVDNSRTVEKTDLVLVDAGAEWGMYCSDISRTFPASGRFSRSQRDLYDVVLAAEEAGIAAARPGAPVSAVHAAAVRVLVRGMLDLRILRGATVDEAISTGSFKRFYMHQSSHWLGLDVHDVGPYAEDGAPVILQPGMVLTVEPGIYISALAPDVPKPFRGVGVRIEDDVLITEAGNEVLTREVPVDPDAIEALIGG